MATGLKTRPILMKGPSARVIPPRLTTKSSTDLLPLEMRLGTSKDAVRYSNNSHHFDLFLFLII